MKKIIAAMLIITAIIHLLPVSGVLGAERLAALYDLSFQEPNLAILMRHRAVMFGLLGLFLIYAAFRPALQPLAFIAGLISAVSFVLVAWLVGGYNDAIDRIIMGDLIAIGCLLVAVILFTVVRRDH